MLFASHVLLLWAPAITERIRLDGDVRRDRDGVKTGAALKRQVLDQRYAVGEDDTCHTGTALEGFLSNRCHVVGDIECGDVVTRNTINPAAWEITTCTY